MNFHMCRKSKWKFVVLAPSEFCTHLEGRLACTQKSICTFSIGNPHIVLWFSESLFSSFIGIFNSNISQKRKTEIWVFFWFSSFVVLRLCIFCLNFIPFCWVMKRKIKFKIKCFLMDAHWTHNEFLMESGSFDCILFWMLFDCSTFQVIELRLSFLIIALKVFSFLKQNPSSLSIVDTPKTGFFTLNLPYTPAANKFRFCRCRLF